MLKLNEAYDREYEEEMQNLNTTIVKVKLLRTSNNLKNLANLNTTIVKVKRC